MKLKNSFCLPMLVSFCFAELKVLNNNISYPLHLFLGTGVGVGANTIELTEIPANPLTQSSFLAKHQSLASFVLSFKVGAFQVCNQQLKTRYYYKLNLNTAPYKDILKQPVMIPLMSFQLRLPSMQTFSTALHT